MEGKKLVIEPKKFKIDSTTIISARIPCELMKKIEFLAKKTNRNRNEIIQILLDYAVDNVVIKDGESEE